MVKIRLTRVGRKKRPSYRIVAIDSHAKRDGRYIEKLGHYNPSENETNLVLDKAKYDAWIKNGAQPTKAITQLIEGNYKFKPYPVQGEVVETAKESENQTENSETA